MMAAVVRNFSDVGRGVFFVCYVAVCMFLAFCWLERCN